MRLMKKNNLYLIVAFVYCLATVKMFAQSAFTKLFDFEYEQGIHPFGALVSDGTYLYGMTNVGGSYSSSWGVIFKIKPDGTDYTKLHEFGNDGNDGADAYGTLTYDGTYLYGMTRLGSFDGTIFKIKPDGTGYIKLFDFTGTNTGTMPHGSLISDGTYLYGMTSAGDTAYVNGTIFKIKPDGTGFMKLHDFNEPDGATPFGSLLYDGVFLYGMTAVGGINHAGTIFKIKPDGSNFTKLLDFGSANGALPLGDLISDGQYLYGMTCLGGGTIFKIKPDGTNFTTLFVFNGSDGSSPNGSLIKCGTYLYGMTTHGGINDAGVIFRIKPDGTGYSKLFDFGGVNGEEPFGSLITDGIYVYGMTSKGGVHLSPVVSIPDGGSMNSGIIFKYEICSPLTITGSTTNLCAGNTITLTTNGINTYTWSTGEIGTNITVTPVVSAIYGVFGGVDSLDCVNSGTILINVSPCIGIAELENDEFKVYPNPANDIIYLETENTNENLFISIIDMYGREVKQSKLQKEINVEDLASGIYVLKIYNSSKEIIHQQKLMKE